MEVQNKLKHQIILSIDFDETIARNNPFPNITGLIEGAAEVIRRLYDEGYYIIINTCRYGDHEAAAEAFLLENKIPYHQINQHHPDVVAFFQNDTRKISADIYIDDKCLFGLPTWEEIYHLVKTKHVNHPLMKIINQNVTEESICQ